jgi:antitoxin ParD1/3/4
MKFVTITLSEENQAFVDRQAAGGGYETGDEYVSKLIEKELARERLRELLMEGANSPPAGEIDDAFFDDLRARIERNTPE